MTRLPTYLLCLLIAVSPGCTTSGPVTGAVLGGAAAVTAVFDQMLADELIKPEQYIQLTRGMEGVQASIAAADTTAKVAQQIATEAKNGAVSPETMAGGLTAASAAVLAAIRIWRGKPKKGAGQVTPTAA